jgi:hypothetical protein
MNEFIQVDDNIFVQVFDYFIGEFATNLLEDVHMFISLSLNLILQYTRLHFVVVLEEIRSRRVDQFLFFLQDIVNITSYPVNQIPHLIPPLHHHAL